MKDKLPETLLTNARELRKNMTDPEKLLWEIVRKHRFMGLKFRRQHPIIEGFILDFYCHELKLGIELDGKGHLKKEQAIYDTSRTIYLNELGIKVIRFSNDEILNNIEKVLHCILDNE